MGASRMGCWIWSRLVRGVCMVGPPYRETWRWFCWVGRWCDCCWFWSGLILVVSGPGQTGSLAYQPSRFCFALLDTLLCFPAAPLAGLPRAGCRLGETEEEQEVLLQ